MCLTRLNDALKLVLKAVPELKKDKYKFYGSEVMGQNRRVTWTGKVLVML